MEQFDNGEHDHDHGFDPADILDAIEMSMCITEYRDGSKGIQVTMSRGKHCLRAVLNPDESNETTVWLMQEVLQGAIIPVSRSTAESLLRSVGRDHN